MKQIYKTNQRLATRLEFLKQMDNFAFRVGSRFTRNTYLKGRFSHYVLSESDVGRASGFQGDWMKSKVFEHIKDGLEPEMLHSALPFVADSQSQMLQNTKVQITDISD